MCFHLLSVFTCETIIAVGRLIDLAGSGTLISEMGTRRLPLDIASGLFLPFPSLSSNMAPVYDSYGVM